MALEIMQTLFCLRYQPILCIQNLGSLWLVGLIVLESQIQSVMDHLAFSIHNNVITINLFIFGSWSISADLSSKCYDLVQSFAYMQSAISFAILLEPTFHSFLHFVVKMTCCGGTSLLQIFFCFVNSKNETIFHFPFIFIHFFILLSKCHAV